VVVKVIQFYEQFVCLNVLYSNPLTAMILQTLELKCHGSSFIFSLPAVVFGFMYLLMEKTGGFHFRKYTFAGHRTVM
jgi:hypothetical protein